jgi:hypothetical protein
MRPLAGMRTDAAPDDSHRETTMIHVVKMIKRRYPERAGSITRTFVIASGSALLLGVGMLIAL